MPNPVSFIIISIAIIIGNILHLARYGDCYKHKELDISNEWAEL